MRARKNARIFVVAYQHDTINELQSQSVQYKETRTERTTIRKPSVTSDKSRAALTRFLELIVLRRDSNSGITDIHASSTSVSRMVVTSDGVMHRSARRLESGFSILCRAEMS